MTHESFLFLMNSFFFILQRKLAIRILSQDCSASPCERNWSTWALFHTKKRNRLSTLQLERLVYCHCNLRLLERGGHSAEVRQVNVDELDIERVHDIPSIPAEDLDLYDMLYQELTVPQHDTRASRTRSSHRAHSVPGPSTSRMEASISRAPHDDDDDSDDDDSDDDSEDFED
ncbi:hypothetical protein KP509_12G009000 [Ceratopteris richardii]|uniref:HAT C-terminal dimerisation domain-containing protein n=1 Tax=Ceratopteris richardii TaxID=49495 RepID=A0A8T2TIZ5_CERRI|nr:hypothetical protein KP509_12G009000 [Ceratopteris richardii]